MQYTTNYNLKKPEGTDLYNIGNENDNMDALDAALAKAHSTDDTASSTINDSDYVPLAASGGAKKKSTWSNIKTVLGKVFASNGTIATVETTSTASQGYAIGAQFVYNGILYEATAAIASGGTITPGTNCDPADSVTSQISSLANQKQDKLHVEVKSGTLAAGSTSLTLTFTTETIGNDTLIDIYSDVFGVIPTDVTTTSTTVTLTFDAQDSAVKVAVVIEN